MKIKKLYVVFLLLLLFFSVSVVSATDPITDISSDNSDMVLGIFTEENNVTNNSNYLSINNNKNNNDNFNLETNSLKKVNLTADNLTMYYNNGSYITARLTDSEGNPIAKQNINFLINGVTYTHTTNSNGYVYQGIGLNPGIYGVNIYYEGSALYEKASTFMTLTVRSTIIGSDIELYYNNGTYYVSKYVDGKGNPIVGATIYMNINGVLYPAITNSEGNAYLYIGLYPNVYIITDYHPNGQLYSNKVTVKSNIIAEDATMGYCEGGSYTFTILDNQGNKLPNALVNINIHGVNYPAFTNKEGVAGLQINLYPNTYLITIIHPNGLMRSQTIKVLNNLDTYEVVENNRNFTESITENLTFTLYNSLNHVLIGKKVTININQKIYILTTDSKGQVNLPIDFDAGVYQGKIIFDKTDGYKLSYKDFTVVVNELTPVNITMLNNKILFEGDNISALFTEVNGTPLANKNVSININNDVYVLQTNDLGIATIQPTLSSGNYFVAFKALIPRYSDQELIENIYLYDTNVTTLEVVNPLVKRGENLEVLLKANSTPIVDKIVNITINGITYPAITNSWGIASLLITLYCKDYPITVSFAGDDLFKPCQINKTIEVYDPVETKITVVGKHVFYVKDTGFYSVRLTDIDGNSIANQDINFKINEYTITNKTDNQGTASLLINLPVGKYTVYYSFDGNKNYAPAQDYGDIIVKESSSVLSAGYYVQKQTVESVDFKDLASKGVNVIFLGSASISEHGQARIQKFINDAHSYGIEVHLWTSIYNDGSYISPVKADESINYDIIYNKANQIIAWLDLGLNFDGVHLDYCRFSEGAYNHPHGIDAITECVDIITNTVKQYDSDLMVSMTLMPERQVSAKHYGQDITQLSKIVDVVIPMAYKGNYKSPSDWIGNVAKWYQDNSQGADVWIAITSYYSDADTRLLSPEELLKDSQSAVDGGSSGVIILRYGYCNDFDFNDIDTSNITPSHDIPLKYQDILNTASELSVEIGEKGILPTYVTVGNVKVTLSQFLYLMSKAIGQMNVSTKDINLILVDNCHADTGDVIYDYLSKKEFMDVANRVATYIEKNGEAPNYASTSIKNIKYSSLLYTFSRILAYYNEYNRIPARVYVDNYLDNSILTVNMKPSSIHTEGYKYINYTTSWLNYCPDCDTHGSLLINPKGVYEGELTCAFCDADFCGVTGWDKFPREVQLTRKSESVPTEPSGDDVSLDSILDAALRTKTFIETYQSLPNYIVIDNAQYSCAKALYLFTQAITNINNGIYTAIKPVSVDDPDHPSGTVKDSVLNKAQYLDVCNRVANFIKNNNLAPNYASSVIGTISYSELVDMSARILAYYKNNDRTLPNSVEVKDRTGPSGKTYQQVAEEICRGLTTDYAKANTIFNYIHTHVSYEFYYNSKRYAQGTLDDGLGNCCDQARLFVGMCNAVGLTTRYMHGTCHFKISGNWYGHVWSQVFVDGKWLTSDTTGGSNSLGNVVNWDYVNMIRTYDPGEDLGF